MVRLSPASGAGRTLDLPLASLSLAGFSAARPPHAARELAPGAVFAAEIPLPGDKLPIQRFARLTSGEGAGHKTNDDTLAFRFCGSDEPSLFDNAAARIQEFVEDRQCADQ